MKLMLVKPSTGLRWVRQGLQLFMHRPFALLGFFVFFLAILSLLSMVPVLGGFLALAFVPAASVGIMQATREALAGQFPRPGLLLTAFRINRQHNRHFLILGLIYVVCVLLAALLTAGLDGGQFARLYLLGGSVNQELVANERFMWATWAFSVFCVPISILFWHAPALVHWCGVTPVKSLFFSLVAIMRNFAAFLIYGLCWAAIMFAGGTLAMLLGLLGSPMVSMFGFVLIGLSLAAAFFFSIWFSFKDNFSGWEAGPAAAV